LLRHIDLNPDQITIITRRNCAASRSRRVRRALCRDGADPRELSRRARKVVGPGDFLLNVSVDVSSVALIELCRELGALYLDTCIEPWPGGYTDRTCRRRRRSNYALRESALALRAGRSRAASAGPTAVLTHGANPGLVSHFVKQALLDVARDTDPGAAAPPTERAGAGWRSTSGSRQSTSPSATRRCRGSRRRRRICQHLVDRRVFQRGLAAGRARWGTHERHFPAERAAARFGSQAAIYLLRPGAATRVRSWTPLEGPITAF